MEIAMDTSAVVEKDGRLHGYGLYPLSVEVTEDGQVRVRCRLTLDEADFSEEAEVWLAGGA